jgi:hypothetical protein
VLVVINDSLALRVLQLLRTALFGCLRNRDFRDIMEANVVIIIIIIFDIFLLI